MRVDPAYLTRILRKFAAAGLTEVRTDPADRRRRILSLTPGGAAALAGLQAAADRDMGRLVQDLPDGSARELADAMQKIDGGAGRQRGRKALLIALRPHRIGDIGWVIERQSRLYAEEYGWNGEYEALVCRDRRRLHPQFPARQGILLDCRAGRRARSARCFSCARATRTGSCVCCMSSARRAGFGVGSRLVAECVDAARHAGYRRLVLWTNDVLVDARRLYERAGFKLAGEERHHSFGKDLVGQNWELVL